LTRHPQKAAREKAARDAAPTGEAPPHDPTLAARVREVAGVTWSRARTLCLEGRVSVDGERCVDPARRVAPASRVDVAATGRKLETGPLARDAIVYHDRDLVVVNKPAGLLSVADEAGNRDTLVDHARTLLRRIDPGGDAKLGVVHRLDRETSGLMMFTRSAFGKRVIATAFREHRIDRVYHAIAHGAVDAARVESDLVLDRGDGLRGSHGVFRRADGVAPAGARRSVTHVRPLEALRGATLVECRLETGRQHQIRIHLAELGHPLVGERVYMRDYRGLRIDAPRPMLHARTLGFVHPRSGVPMTFESEPPGDFVEMVAALRG
jgi:23S rRNA pseudouridine1911/1915/1917 synthase